MKINRYERQSFLGENSQDAIAKAKVAILGLGGGGSHIGQQLAHLGFLNYGLFDPGIIEDVNLNRTVGATAEDVKNKLEKVLIAKRVIKTIQPTANVQTHALRWQEVPATLQGYDFIFGALDGFDERRQAEAECRRYLLPYIDIGLGVTIVGDEPPIMAGQVILSMPDSLCMHCMGFLNPNILEIEAKQYGDAGPRAQVIWANGVLASTAVGFGVDLVTDWSRSLRRPKYLQYLANDGSMRPHARTEFFPERCDHYPIGETGKVCLRKL